MEAMPQEWTEGRLNELSKRVDRGFDRTESEIHGLGSEIQGVREEIGGIRKEVQGVREEIGSVQRTIAYGAIALAGAMLAGFAGMCTLIAATL